MTSGQLFGRRGVMDEWGRGVEGRSKKEKVREKESSKIKVGMGLKRGKESSNKVHEVDNEKARD